jgi:hypothetical protein
MDRPGFRVQKRCRRLDPNECQFNYYLPSGSAKVVSQQHGALSVRHRTYGVSRARNRRYSAIRGASCVRGFAGISCDPLYKQRIPERASMRAQNVHSVRILRHMSICILFNGATDTPTCRSLPCAHRLGFGQSYCCWSTKQVLRYLCTFRTDFAASVRKASFPAEHKALEMPLRCLHPSIASDWPRARCRYWPNEYRLRRD